MQKQLSDNPRVNADWTGKPIQGFDYTVDDICAALRPELDLGVEFKFLQLANTVMGEGSWPCPHRYTRFMGHSGGASVGLGRSIGDSCLLDHQE